MSEHRHGAGDITLPTPADVSMFEDGGKYVVRSQDGMALYRYDLDTDGKPHCLDACSRRWPPFLASAGATAVVGEWRTIARGAERQWAFRGRPVYTFAQDSQGTQAGDGIEGVWHVLVL